MAPAKRSAASAAEAVSSPIQRVATEKRQADSPLKRLKAARQQRTAARVARDEVVLSTVEEFRDYILKNETGQPPNPDVDVVVCGIFLWASAHTYGDRRLVRLHVTDANPDEAIEDLMEFKSTHALSEEDRIDVDALLLTVTVFSESLESPNIPQDGAKLRIVSSRRRLVYEDKFCQLVTRLADIRIECDNHMTALVCRD